MSMSYFPVSMGFHLTAWKRELAHNRSKRTRDLEMSSNQHCHLPLKPLSLKIALCLIETLTWSATSLPAEKDQSVTTRIL